ncbi:UdgX family uracil-DNA binding protein [Rhodobacterales bacterium HKCCE4037]|nr:UdgX family uracil-DNA binding protein [Rhodobacterales bacterium HKCCE4037]
MYRVTLPRIGTAQAWRAALRSAVTNDIPPGQIDWAFDTSTPSLFDAAPLPAPRAALTVPKAFAKLADGVIWHSDPERFAHLHAALLRARATPALLSDPGDEDMARLRRMAKNVGRCIHKMHAFVRFRELPTNGPRPRFAAWFEPTHHTVEPGTPFFAKRFGDMDWLIATPDITARFEDGHLSFEEAAPRPDLPEDATEDLWTEYYRSIFNPARVKVSAMRSEMPVKYWKNMPETRIIPELLSGAEARVRQMQEAAPTLPPVYAQRVMERRAPARVADRMDPDIPTLDALRTLASEMPLQDGYGRMVLGEGPSPAPLMIVGEQPGDMEDRAGRPFVGPAGQLFDRIAKTAGLRREDAYVTNAVKRFRYRQTGKRRLHQPPNRGDIEHGKWWLDLERRFVKPKLTLAMGGTAAEALTGERAGLLKRRGRIEDTENGPVFLTLHPAYILRLPDAEQRAEAEEAFASDLAAVQARLVEMS